MVPSETYNLNEAREIWIVPPFAVSRLSMKISSLWRGEIVPDMLSIVLDRLLGESSIFTWLESRST